ncbi:MULTISPECIES: tRNA pseudouridine(38-40) synthase TruA [Salimicrobium]|uniref:tRNA pseudouridine synthase A n=3 Tax=Salimicrobium TaxID=351195 RepID=K2G7Q4_9BACI|nr:MULTISPECIES: tRNA pseudouridine(38-40) synthase TruA [Salimicrobium]AKG05563.1 tRNA pseudouridine(38-40) synthase TruA [Salimicrobium jeotgali]EKE30442.1 tRNA pseudouridine synthase A [Salimicrobium jeotgali]MBM7696585.1 tRNA pseudouridine38-40 synthase [Salimicrobium jeotgali]SDY25992.1 tRNA pseudouridine38-40 synthase [Salimicrobium album]SIS93231.1 tRNA pseudouridine38-40 synthase [Salimicrobium salexigens]
MKRVKCTVEYDGTGYSGFQIQPNGKTVQEELEKALRTMHKGEHVRIIASGRTDAGVHAKGQVFHFDTSLAVPENRWVRALETLLPSDIYVKQAEYVEESFHAQFDVKEKEYRYYVRPVRSRDVFRRRTVYHHPRNLDIEKMQEAVKQFLGTHDFTAFCSAKTTLKGNKIRTVSRAELNVTGEELEFIVRGNGFLYNMVRIMMGTLLEIGEGKKEIDTIPRALAEHNRRLAGFTTPGHGLFLWEVSY